MHYGIVISHDSEIITLCENVGKEIGLKVIFRHDLANFILCLQENNFHVAVFDFNDLDNNKVKWVKVIKKIRPKIPLIVLTKESNKITGSKMYEEGLFYNCIKPIHKDLLRSVLSAAITSYSG